MKNNLACLVVAVATLIAAPSCTTTYDAYGRPVQSVDPGAAALGAAAAGAAGYAIGRNNRDDRRYHHRGGYRRHYGRHHHRTHWR